MSMKDIPYGYRIENGKAVIDTEAADRIHNFIDTYLSGLSVKEANKTAEIPLSASSLNKLLQNKTYLGTDYYPPLISAEVFQSVQVEKLKRTHPGTATAAEPVAAKNRFVMRTPDTNRHGDAKETASYLYSLITTSDVGMKSVTPAEAASIRAYAEQNTQHSAVRKETENWQ